MACLAPSCQLTAAQALRATNKNINMSRQTQQTSDQQPLQHQFHNTNNYSDNNSNAKNVTRSASVVQRHAPLWQLTESNVDSDGWHSVAEPTTSTTTSNTHQSSSSSSNNDNNNKNSRSPWPMRFMAASDNEQQQQQQQQVEDKVKLARMRQQASQVSAFVGRNVILNCPVHFKGGIERPFVVNWFKYPATYPFYIWFAGYPAFVGPQFEQRLSRLGAASLNLTQVRHSDSGLYLCEITQNHQDKTISLIQMDVQGKWRNQLNNYSNTNTTTITTTTNSSNYSYN